MDHLAEIRTTFFQECEEQLAALESGLLAMQSGDASSDTVNAVFRAVHSIKGGAGAFKLADLVNFAHTFETLLDKIRSGSLTAEASIIKVLLRAADKLSDLVNASREGDDIDPAGYQQLMEELGAAGGNAGTESEGGSEDEDDFIGFTPTLIAVSEPPASYEIHFRPHAELYRKANEPQALLRELENLGPINIHADVEAIPDLTAFDWNASYLAFNIELETDKGEQAIRDVFEFVDGDCDLSIKAVLLSVPDEAPKPLEVLVQDELPSLSPEEASKPAPSTQLTSSTATQSKAQQTIRVDLERVDRLINLVGELVINQAMLSMRFGQLGPMNEPESAASLLELETLTREIQESVMAIRAQPVKSLFQRMSRIVREVADATGKQVRLVTQGEGTEIDKTVIELLADPLTHMIRNAVDHGLESPETRVASGKTPEGTVVLSAAHRSGRVVITVSDDGGGINRPKVLQAAISKGLVPEGTTLNDGEIDNLLFLPGFSTANSVSNISGRGVGMDVVKRSIQALGGRISISSAPRQGTTFAMSLPLTLAVLDGIIVAVSGDTFVIPLTAVVETLQPEKGMLLQMGQGSVVMRVRDEFVPLVDVGYELGVRPRMGGETSGVTILVETENQSRCALLVDAIQDQRQVVIKSLETNYGKVAGIAAATILGDGRVAMILDVDNLVRGKDMPGSEREIEMARAS